MYINPYAFGLRRQQNVVPAVESDINKGCGVRSQLYGTVVDATMGVFGSGCCNSLFGVVYGSEVT